MRLVIFHYHDRPGGVRQVISRGLVPLVTRLGGVRDVVLLMGETTDAAWVRGLESLLLGVPLRVIIHPDFGYLSGALQKIGAEARKLADGALSGRDVLVWAHNLSVGRNLPLLVQLPEWCAGAGARLWLHHHDWWWDGRWARWADWQAAGIFDLKEALELSVPTGPHIRHWCVNLADLPWLQIRAGRSAQWVGNPLPEPSLPHKSEIINAANWLHSRSSGRRVWLAPVRALRRKNLAEAILLAQQQSEATCVITTGGPGSIAEVPAWEALCQAAARHHWPFVPAVLAPTAIRQRSSNRASLTSVPSLPALLAASDAVVMPSLQEGFGLPYLEAAAYDKPLLARALPEAAANLAALGCSLRGSYDRLPVSLGSFNAEHETTRLTGLRRILQSKLPIELTTDMESASIGGDDFGTLTLKAQLEVLQSKDSFPSVPSGPQVPLWPAGSRVDSWVERFFKTCFNQDQNPAGPQTTQVRSAPPSILPEVVCRFHYWRDHPLLWP